VKFVTTNFVSTFHRHNSLAYLYNKPKTSQQFQSTILYSSLSLEQEMGSLEEDELVQMVQDFIESDHSSNSPTSFITSSNHHPLHNRTQYFILQVGTLVFNEFKVLKKCFLVC
jgi:hypothetical protein